MKLVRGGLRRRQFDAFIADATDALFRAGHLMTGDAGAAEDLVQETFIRVARRWDRVRVMDHPVAYARRVLVNLAVTEAERRSRQQAELTPQPQSARGPLPSTAAMKPSGSARLMISELILLLRNRVLGCRGV